MNEKYTHHIPAPCTEDIKVVFADDHLLVLNKPSGLLTVPGRFVKDSVEQRMAYEYPDARIVHRLDLDTSGLMVMAMTDFATRDLNRQFREREIDKEYIARVYGRVVIDSGEINLPLRADPDNRPRHLVDMSGGKEAITHFEAISADDDSSLLLLRPATGRSHQLRIHLAEIGHPILGCDLYAHEKAFAAADRLMLHASGLRFIHPGTRETVEFSLAPDFC